MQKMRTPSCVPLLILLCQIQPGMPDPMDMAGTDVLAIHHIKAPNGVFAMKNGLLKLQGGSLHLKIRLIDRSVIHHAVARTIQNIKQLLNSNETKDHLILQSGLATFGKYY